MEMGAKLFDCITEEKRHRLNTSVRWGSIMRDSEEEEEASEAAGLQRAAGTAAVLTVCLLCWWDAQAASWALSPRLRDGGAGLQGRDLHRREGG